jgi:hypothetical protein
MARYSIEGLGRLYHVPTIATVGSPTTTELNAGTDLTTFVPRDGFAPNLTQNVVDISAISDRFDITAIGSEGGSFTLTLYRDNSADTAWNLYVASNVTGYLAWREGIANTTAWTSGQALMVWPYQAHKPIPVATAQNAGRKFTIMVAITTTPSRNAVVA